MTSRPSNLVLPGELPKHIIHEIPALSHYERGRVDAQGVVHHPTDIIVHNTEDTDDAVDWLTWQSIPPASIHVIAERDGTRVNIVQYGDTAWHVGYCKPGFSRYTTLGIELANASNHWGRHEPYPDAQLNTAAYTVATWCFSYGIPRARIWKHTEIAVWPPDEAAAHKPGDLRRYDPSNLDWEAFKLRVDQWVAFFRTLDPVLHPYYII